MTDTDRFLSSPGPVVTPASNPHRAGDPNHHHNNGRDRNAAVAPTSVTGKGHSLGHLVATLLAENTALREQLVSATAELDAANDAVIELIAQRDQLAADLQRGA